MAHATQHSTSSNTKRRATQHHVIGARYLVLSATAAAFTLIAMGTTSASDGLWAYHGTMMMLFAVLPAMFCGFGHLILPKDLGPDRTAFPALSQASLVLFALSLCAMIASRFAPGFFDLSTLSGGADHDTAPNSTAGTLALAAVLSCALSLLFAALNLVGTSLVLRTRALFDLSGFAWALLLTGWMLLLALPIIAAALVTEVLANGALLHRALWFFTHPAVYVIALPGLGLTGQIIRDARHPKQGPHIAALILLTIASLGYTLWAEQLFNSGLHRAGRDYDAAMLIALSLPILALVGLWLRDLMAPRAPRKNTIPLLWAISNVVLTATSTVIATYWALTGRLTLADMTAHFHYAIALSAAFSIFAALYLYMPRIAGRSLMPFAGYIQFATMVAGCIMVFLPKASSHAATLEAASAWLEPVGRALSAGSFALFIVMVAWAAIRPKGQ